MSDGVMTVRIFMDVEVTSGMESTPNDWNLTGTPTAEQVVERLKEAYTSPGMAAEGEGLLDDVKIVVTVVPDDKRATGWTVAEWKTA